MDAGDDHDLGVINRVDDAVGETSQSGPPYFSVHPRMMPGIALDRGQAGFHDAPEFGAESFFPRGVPIGGLKDFQSGLWA